MRSRKPLTFGAALLALACGSACSTAGRPQLAALERIQVTGDGQRFIRAPSGRSFTPWGFNYDHDEQLRLLEDYWVSEWPKVEEDFGEMKALGANVVRGHPARSAPRLGENPEESGSGA
jgi:hypothetical protein